MPGPFRRSGVDVLHQDRADQDQLILAASKSVIAHLEGAAGVAGITKLVKMLEHKWGAPATSAADIQLIW